MSKHPPCRVCDEGVQADLTLSNRALGRKYDMDEKNFRRHRKHASAPDDNPDEFFGIPNSIITSRGKTVRLPDGSYEKIHYSPAALALLETLQYDDLERAVAGFKGEPAKARGRALHTSTLNAADWQFGKAQTRGGGTPETVAKVMRAFHAFADHVRLTQPNEIVVVDNGDIIENMFNVPQQGYTNDLSIDAQMRTARRTMIEGLKILAPLAPNFKFVSVPSNHGAVRSNFKVQAGTTDADFGLEVNYQIEDVCAEHQSAALRNIEFVRPDALEETAVIETGNTKIAYHHGHQANQDKQGDWWAKQDHGRRPGWDADLLVTGHYHTLSLRQSGNGRWHIGVSSPEPGSDWFTNKTGETSKKGLTAFDVQDGRWYNLTIL